MIEISSRKSIFRRKSYWFSQHPYDVSGCDAVYFYAINKCHDIAGFQRSTSHTLQLDLSSTLETLKKNMSKSCRYEVNRASREGLHVKKGQDAHAFHKIYRDFVHAKAFNGDLDKYWHYIEAGNLYTCYFDGQLIAGLVTLQDDQYARWIISGSNRLAAENSKLTGFANRLLVWEAIMDAKENGIKWFDFGGYYSGENQLNPEYRIAQFKKGFGGTPAIQYKYAKYYSLILRVLKWIKR